MTIHTSRSVATDPFQQVLDGAPIGIAIGRPDGEIVFVNQAMRRILGRPDGDISVGTFVDAAHPDHTLRVRIRLRAIEAGRDESFVRDTRFVHADGTVVHARFHVGVVRDDDGAVTHFIAHAEDITGSRVAEAALADTERRFRAASEASLDALLLMATVRDADGAVVDLVITDANDNAARLYGVPAPNLVGRRISDHFPPEHHDALLAKYTAVVETGTPAINEFRVSHPRVRAEWIREQIVRVGDGVAQTASDISESKRTELALRESDERLRALLQHAVDVVCVVDAGGYIRYASPAVERVLGYTVEEFVALHPFDLVHPDDLTGWMEQWQHLAGGADARFTFEVRARHRDGGYRWMEVGFGDLRSDARVGGFVIHFHDVGERRAAQEALLHQSLHDALTGLPNRVLLLDRLAHALDRATRQPGAVAVLFCDIDHFKDVNDALGHAVGDALLVEVAARLRAAVRPGDTVARLGGDEFVVCCDDISGLDAVHATAERVREVFRRPFGAAGHELTVGTSMGVAIADATTESPDELLRNADAAMYVAKARGRDRAVVYDDALRRRVLEHLDTEAGLRRALEDGDLAVHWQPVFATDDAGVVGIEALVRWRHPERGLLLPADFLDAASLAGLDAMLGAYVIDAACEQYAAWLDEGIAPPVMWLNLSPSQLTWSGTVGHVRDALARFGIAPDRLGFDVTEHAIADIDRARKASAELAGLSDLGCAIAIDDFGTGHASPLAVRRYGITHVKLDRSLVQTTADDDPMLPALMSLASMLGVTVLAEGVETPEQWDRVRRAGCRAATGNHLAAAAEAAVAEEHLRVSPVRDRPTAPGRRAARRAGRADR